MEYFVEGLGYLASVLVALSLTMSNVWRLRWINLAGAFVFVAYAGSIAAWPVLLVNAWIVLVDVFYIRQMTRNRDSFEAFTREADDPMLRSFVSRYKSDIIAYFPDFEATISDPDGTASGTRREWLLVTRNLSPVGLVVYDWSDDAAVNIRADYVTPAYRDFKNGGQLYAENEGFFASKGASLVVAYAHVDEHRRYLRRLGFDAGGSDAARYVKRLS
ncbi:MAG: hypothetical protein ACLFM0_07020 [Spirochaetales bacterium]